MKKSISSASAKLGSRIYPKAVYPKWAPNVELLLTEEQAVELAAKILVVAKAENALGLICVTGYNIADKKSSISVIRRVK